jgi:hypothetical protein
MTETLSTSDNKPKYEKTPKISVAVPDPGLFESKKSKKSFSDVT